MLCAFVACCHVLVAAIECQFADMHVAEAATWEWLPSFCEVKVQTGPRVGAAQPAWHWTGVCLEACGKANTAGCWPHIVKLGVGGCWCGINAVAALQVRMRSFGVVFPCGWHLVRLLGIHVPGQTLMSEAVLGSMSSS